MIQLQLQEAKAKLSELVKLVQTDGPREITVHGEARAVIVSIEQYERMTGRQPTFLETMRKAQAIGVELELPPRVPEKMRKIKL